MKKTLLIFIFIITLSLSNSYANIESYFMFATYKTTSTPYIETYMSFIGNSLSFVKKDSGKFAAKIEITILIFRGDSVFVVDKYNLSSPEVEDSTSVKPNFIDVQRYAIKAGNYNLKITIKDLNSSDIPSTYNDIIMLNFNDTDLSIGGIEYVERTQKTDQVNNLTKNGYQIIPYISNFFPHNVESLKYYFEIYNSDVAIKETFALKLYIEKFETKEIKIEQLKKINPAPIIPYIGEFNINGLTSGNYNLVIELLNMENKSLYKEKFFFQRSGNQADNIDSLIFKIEQNISDIFSGNFENRDTLMNYIFSLRPIANPKEQRFIDYEAKTANIKALQNFFIDFWMERNSSNPNGIWNEYNEQVKYVNRAFGTKAKKGYRCDMGYVYLKYGAPNEIYDSPHEPEAYPYQIWKYWKINAETNRKFVFYNSNLATRDYDLLHSNAKGEIVTANWERYLRKRTHDLYNHDAMQGEDNVGSRALEEFKK